MTTALRCDKVYKEERSKVKEEKYDSALATEEHINMVNKIGNDVITKFSRRLHDHDESKLNSPEKEIFDEFTPKLKTSTYGSDEYKQFLLDMKPALDHHYSVNRHHPEYFEHGINDMNLLDLLEMLIDWKAATLRHDDGDILKSLEINQKRFGYSNELKSLLLRTIGYMVW